MNAPAHDLFKVRELHFCSLLPHERQAPTAMQMLADVREIQILGLCSDDCLHIRYDITLITLRMIEETLLDFGFHFDNSLLARLKRALYYYTEETQRYNLGYTDVGHNNIQDVFINRYQRLRHGCRDERPQHWRVYK